MHLPNPLPLLDCPNDIMDDTLSFLSNRDDIFNPTLSLSDLLYQQENNVSVSNSSFNENNKEDTNMRPKFIIERSNRKRGRKITKNKKKQKHTALSPDNIINKIQTHFLNFVVFFIMIVHVLLLLIIQFVLKNLIVLRNVDLLMIILIK